jgi:hypothetical protein
MRFPYQRDEISPSPIDGSNDLYRPEIPLHLIGESGEVFVFGLVDTGADGVVLSREIATALGVVIDETIRWTLRGFNVQSIDAVLGHVDVEIMDTSESVVWRMPVAVVTFDDPSSEDIILLGQTGFLRFFDIRFLGGEHIVELISNETFSHANR